MGRPVDTPGVEQHPELVVLDYLLCPIEAILREGKCAKLNRRVILSDSPRFSREQPIPTDSNSPSLHLKIGSKFS